MIMKYFSALIIVCSLSLPNFSHAQAQDEYRSYLLKIIANLQAQITLLQAQLDEQSTQISKLNTDFESFILPDSAQIFERYQISNVDAVSLIADDNNRMFFKRFFSIVPDAYDDDITELVVFTDEEEGIDAFVETVPSQKGLKWRFGISSEVFKYPVQDKATSELFVHEFAHILSYAPVPTVSISGPTTCHKYFDGFGCPPEDSYFVAFLDEYWSDNDLDNLIDFGTNAWSSSEQKYYFVSTYAATAPEEDFAESFAQFVLETRQSNTTVAKQKINFFYQYPELVKMRNEIRSNL